MKYKNCPAKPLGKGEMLHFVQQFWIWADIIGKMLYSVQDFNKLPEPCHKKRMNREIPAATAAKRKRNSRRGRLDRLLKY
jgi:hypothetical protein